MIRFTLVCLGLGLVVLVAISVAGTVWAIPLALLAVAAGLAMVMESLA